MYRAGDSGSLPEPGVFWRRRNPPSGTGMPAWSAVPESSIQAVNSMKKQILVLLGIKNNCPGVEVV
jgi:hypothetical protein